MNNMLSVRNLTVTIGDQIVCRDLSFTVEQDQSWGVLGGNGVGKTTLLHTLAGLREPDAGTIYVVDRPLTEWPRRDLAQTVGVLPQDSTDPFPATVLETALIGRHPHLKAWEWEDGEDLFTAREALRAVGLQAMADRQVATLSGGERRRLAIATLLTQNRACSCSTNRTTTLISAIKSNCWTCSSPKAGKAHS
nr:ABC transporter ATP-binding protein [Alkalilimnicola ehrlichii]